jgi:hypothetical protein
MSFVYRDYVDDDDEHCKALEMRAMQGGRYPALQKFVTTFVRAGFHHRVTFDAKAKQYTEHVIRVVEEQSDAKAKKVVAVGCAVLKTAYMLGEMVKIAYVFDLRVDEDYQGKGIG